MSVEMSSIFYPCVARNLKSKASLGFTLVEVLIALGIVALALAAGMRATAALTGNAERQTNMILAQLCAENALIAVRLARQMPVTGDERNRCDQAELSLDVHLSVRPTPNPNFVRVQAQVFDGEYPLVSLSTVVGRY